ncbi:MAG: MBL fold metallo-hydrolase, partial [Bacilli bacterium]|nr:MBL fold metallo-hydrolase [Bacilli bacterium]
MKFQMLSSGSKGNCAIILSDDANIIIDAGISYLTLKKKLEENSLSFDQFDAILITHCHKDHTSGLASIIKKSTINAYVPEKMYDSIKEYIPYPRCTFIGDEFNINSLEIELIHTSHDAPCSVGFLIKSNDKKMCYITDTGYLNRKYLAKMVGLDMYVIESNHDEVMLMDGPYPRFLKERVISDKGHLSNITTAKYLKKIIGKNTKNIVLAHLSETNNTHELALKTLREQVPDENIHV